MEKDTEVSVYSVGMNAAHDRFTHHIYTDDENGDSLWNAGRNCTVTELTG
jgi:hypothetical protein